MEELLLQDLSTRDWLQILNQSLTAPQTLPQILQQHQVSTQQLIDLARASKNSNEPYGRQILFKSPEIEVMLAKWSFQASASPHNHGFSKGLIWFLKGNFSEQHYEFKQGKLIESGVPTIFNEGAVATVISSDIHSCCPDTEGISLHLYSPAIQKMKVWDLKAQETLTVADECGAWIPQNSNLIVKRVKWN